MSRGTDRTRPWPRRNRESTWSTSVSVYDDTTDGRSDATQSQPTQPRLVYSPHVRHRACRRRHRLRAARPRRHRARRLEPPPPAHRSLGSTSGCGVACTASASSPSSHSSGRPSAARDSWRYAIAFFTYVINVPAWLFVEALVGPGWRQSIRRVWQVQVVYAIAAIAADLLLGRPRAAMSLNSPIVLAGLAIGLANLWFLRRRLGRLFTTPAIVAGASLWHCSSSTRTSAAR